MKLASLSLFYVRAMASPSRTSTVPCQTRYRTLAPVYYPQMVSPPTLGSRVCVSSSVREEAPGSVQMCRVSSLACMEPTCGVPGDEVSIRWQPANCYGVNASDASRVQILCRFGDADVVARRVVSGSAAHLRCTVPSLAAGRTVGVRLVIRDMRDTDPSATELVLKLHTRLEHNDALRTNAGLAPTHVVHHQLMFRHEPDPVRSALCSCSVHRQATSDTAGYLCSACGICHNMYPGVGVIPSLGEATKAEAQDMGDKAPSTAPLNTTMANAVAAARAFRLDCTGKCFGVASTTIAAMRGYIRRRFCKHGQRLLWYMSWVCSETFAHVHGRRNWPHCRASARLQWRLSRQRNS